MVRLAHLSPGLLNYASYKLNVLEIARANAEQIDWLLPIISDALQKALPTLSHLIPTYFSAHVHTSSWGGSLGIITATRATGLLEWPWYKLESLILLPQRTHARLTTRQKRINGSGKIHLGPHSSRLSHIVSWDHSHMTGKELVEVWAGRDQTEGAESLERSLEQPCGWMQNDQLCSWWFSWCRHQIFPIYRLDHGRRNPSGFSLLGFK